MSDVPKLPMVSVRLMTYNHERFVTSAIEGVLLQKTNFDVEIIVGDDFSTDHTLDVVKKFENTKNISIRVLDRKKGDSYELRRNSLGRLYNFKDILNHCKGRYIALLDGDDCWKDPLKLQKQVDFLECNPDYVASFHNVSIVDTQDTILEHNFLPEIETTYSQLQMIAGAIMPTSSVLYRNVIKLPENFTSAKNGDTFLYAMLANYGKAALDLSIQSGYYRKHDGGIWSTSENLSKLKNGIITYKEIKKATHTKYFRIVNRVIASKYYSLMKSSPVFIEKISAIGMGAKYLAYYILNKVFKIPV